MTQKFLDDIKILDTATFDVIGARHVVTRANVKFEGTWFFAYGLDETSALAALLNIVNTFLVLGTAPLDDMCSG
jgi:hypothetical protein